jgi:hypothetical protein
MSPEEVLVRIEQIVEQRPVEPASWYSALSAVRDELENWHVSH